MSSIKESPQARTGASQGLSASRRAYNMGMRTLIYIAAAIVVVLLVLVLPILVYQVKSFRQQEANR